jgi:hypothetical protein
MRITFYLLFIIVMPAISFSQMTDKDSTTEQILKHLCDNKFFEKCEIPVDFKYDQKTLEDSITNYLKANNSQKLDGKATFIFIVAPNSKVYNVAKKSRNIESESDILKALEATSDLWTIGKQNSYLICSYVELEVIVTDHKVKVKKIR